MKKVFIILFIIFSINANASIIGAIIKGLDGLFDDLFTSSKPVDEDTINYLGKTKFSGEENIIISSKQFDVVKSNKDIYIIKWKDSTLDNFVKTTNNSCNKEEAKLKGKEVFEKYIEYEKAFNKNLTEKIIHDQIIKTISKKLITYLGITKVEINTIGKYPYLKEISIKILSACGYEVTYNILKEDITIKGYRIKSEIK